MTPAETARSSAWCWLIGSTAPAQVLGHLTTPELSWVIGAGGTGAAITDTILRVHRCVASTLSPSGTRPELQLQQGREEETDLGRQLSAVWPRWAWRGAAGQKTWLLQAPPAQHALSRGLRASARRCRFQTLPRFMLQD